MAWALWQCEKGSRHVTVVDPANIPDKRDGGSCWQLHCTFEDHLTRVVTVTADRAAMNNWRNTKGE